LGFLVVGNGKDKPACQSSSQYIGRLSYANCQVMLFGSGEREDLLMICKSIQSRSHDASNQATLPPSAKSFLASPECSMRTSPTRQLLTFTMSHSIGRYLGREILSRFLQFGACNTIFSLTAYTSPMMVALPIGLLHISF
jgi:hypothetical protein